MNKKILSVVDMISSEKSLPREKIFEALELALSIATKRKYTQEIDVRVKINRTSGDFYTFRRWTVVNQVKYPTREITLEAARLQNASIQLSEFIENHIQSITFDRITIQIAKKIILQKVQYAEKIMVINNFYNYKGRVITGIVKKIYRDYIILQINNYIQAIINKKNMLPKEKFKIGDYVSGILYDIRPSIQGIQAFVSRIKLEMLIELLHMEIPEIREKIIKIKSVVRFPGFRSKVAVISNNSKIDPIGACIGVRGSRIKAISQIMGGEKIDIILWDQNPIKFITNIFSPMHLISVMLHKNKYEMDIAVQSTQLAIMIGRVGNITQLASRLIGWHLNIMTIHDFYYKNTKIRNSIKNIFIKILNIKCNIINILLQEGIFSIEQLICTTYFKLLNIKNITKKIIYNMQDKSNRYFARNLIKRHKDILQSKENILSVLKIKKKNIFQFFKKNIFNLEDLANQSIYEIIKYNDLEKNNLKSLVMHARNLCWFHY